MCDLLNYHPPKGRDSYVACNQEDRKFDLTVSFFFKHLLAFFSPPKGKCFNTKVFNFISTKKLVFST